LNKFFHFLGVPVEYVQCSNVETEIWSRISRFENQYYIKNFLNQRVSKINRNDSLFDGCQNNRSIQDFGLIKEVNINDDLLLRITNTAKQAREFYFASSSLPLLSKPILLIYALEKLSELLVLCTFNIPFVKIDGKEMRYRHGVSYYDKIISIKGEGIFQIFHDSFSDDSTIYVNKSQFKLEDLLRIDYKSIDGNANYIDIFNMMKGKHSNDYFEINIKEHSSNSIVDLHELDREFLFMFAISTLARYKVDEWSTMLDGKESDLILRIQEYIQTILSSFPNIVRCKISIRSSCLYGRRRC
jgi:hypothetical protein